MATDHQKIVIGLACLGLCAVYQPSVVNVRFKKRLNCNMTRGVDSGQGAMLSIVERVDFHFIQRKYMDRAEGFQGDD